MGAIVAVLGKNREAVLLVLELLEEFNTATTADACPRQILGACLVRTCLLRSGECQEGAHCRLLPSRHDAHPGFAGTDRHCRGAQDEAKDRNCRGFPDAFIDSDCVATSHVAKLVGNDALQLVDIIGRRKQSAMDIDDLALRDEGISELNNERAEKGLPALPPAEVDAHKSGEKRLIYEINKTAPGQGDAYKDKFLQAAHLFRVSPFWLIFAYMVVTLGELMLSPMGLSLVSKVAPISKRGLLMGGWFVATAIGNKLTQIGVFWDIWLQSTFFLVLASMALFMAVVLFLILKPLKRAMPGV